MNTNVIEENLTGAQEDLYQRTLADEYLKEVFVVNSDHGVIESDLTKALGVYNSRGGKVGACVIVMPPVADIDGAEVEGGVMNTTFTFRVLENPLTNRKAGGTEKRGLWIARRLVMIHHFYHAKGLMGVLAAKNPSIVPVEDPLAPLAYEVPFVASEDCFAPKIKVSTPGIASAGGALPYTVTLSCVTADAQIFYSTDGSFPWAGNPGALLYAAPFQVTSAKTVRACAFKTGLIASDVASTNFE